MSITVNDLLDLMAFRDEVTITNDHTGEDIFDGFVDEVPDEIRMMEPCMINAYANEYIGYDTTIQIGVEVE